MSQSKGAHEQGQKWEPCSFNIIYRSSNAYARYHLSEEGRLLFAPEIVPRKGISGIFSGNLSSQKHSETFGLFRSCIASQVALVVNNLPASAGNQEI